MARQTDIEQDKREYITTHPWITFRLDVGRAPWTFWDHIGEARSKCRHLSRTPLPPDLAQKMERIYLAKGARATTAIEGNSLSEEQAVAAVEGNLHLPQSQEYLRKELENVINAIWAIEREIYAGSQFDVTPERLRDLNRRVLDGLEVPDHVTPGAFRTKGVAVGGAYRGAPAYDCEYLVETMCAWLNGPDFRGGGEDDDHAQGFMLAILRAVVAHVYIAWIHPFGDGNGRTARLIEFGILTAAGIPSVAAHLLSNHYNATRSRYYRELEYASKSGGEMTRFLAYAVEGFVDELQQQLDEVHGWIVEAAWINHVHSIFADARTNTARRQRNLALALPAEDFVPRSQISTLTPQLAEAYAGKQVKTVTRDLNALSKLGLIERGPRGIRAKREIMLSLLPRVAPGVESDRATLFPAAT
jgi:cell filamentation protein, protein adenylyltransferase